MPLDAPTGLLYTVSPARHCPQRSDGSGPTRLRCGLEVLTASNTRGSMPMEGMARHLASNFEPLVRRHERRGVRWDWKTEF